jgi:FkbM family methyltransferase
MRTADNGKFFHRPGTWDEAIVKETTEYQIPEKFGPTDVVIDIGAHIGGFIYQCLQRGARRFVVYEPDSNNFQLLLMNVRRWKEGYETPAPGMGASGGMVSPMTIPTFELVNAAVGITNGQVNYYPSGDSNTGAGYIGPAGGGVSVQGVAIAEVIEKAKSLGDIRILKIDAEYSEYPVIYGLGPDGLQDIPEIVGEYHDLEPAHDDNARKLLTTLVPQDLNEKVTNFLRSNGKQPSPIPIGHSGLATGIGLAYFLEVAGFDCALQRLSATQGQFRATHGRTVMDPTAPIPPPPPAEPVPPGTQFQPGTGSGNPVIPPGGTA